MMVTSNTSDTYNSLTFNSQHWIDKALTLLKIQLPQNQEIGLKLYLCYGE